MDVHPTLQSQAGTYNMRLFAYLSDYNSITASTDFDLTVEYDPCICSLIVPTPIPDYTYDVALPLNE